MSNSTIRAKRKARRKSNNIVKNEELYEKAEVGLDEYEEPSEQPLIEIEERVVQRRKFKPLKSSTYDYKTMAELYSKQNIAQQLGNYRQALEFMAHYTMPRKMSSDNLIDRFKDIIHDYPNIDFSSFMNKENSMLYSWIIEQMIRVHGDKYLGTLYMMGGGMGILPAMLLDTTLRFENIRSFDINGTAQFLADEMMKRELLQDWKFKSATQDLFKIDYQENVFSCTLPNGKESKRFDEIPGTIINHNISYLVDAESWWNMIPDQKKIVIVGETEGPNVTRPFASSQQFNTAFPMTYEQYTGVLTLDVNGKLKQFFMKIGLK